MQFDRYLAALSGDGEALAVAADSDLDAAVTACPGWSVARLVGHTGRLHRWAAEMVRANATDRLNRRDMAEAPDGPDLVPWFREGVSGLVDGLRTAGPDAPVWAFAGPHRSSFWYRRMAQETSIHRWDGERAVGLPSSIASDLAADGIDELLDVFVPQARPGARDSPPGRIHLVATGVDRQWDLALGDGAATATAKASSLLLFLWGRIDVQALNVAGDGDLLGQWQSEIQI